MPYCPISFQKTTKSDGSSFSLEGLRSLHPKLTRLEPLELTHEEQLREASLRANKMSVQGVQPKLSAQLKIKEGRFHIVDQDGRYLLKPNPPPFEEVPANEAVTMSMATAVGIDVPVHGLVQAVDGNWVYFVKRFDRIGRNGKLHVEDFTQLLGSNRNQKYNSTLERVANAIDQYCSFPALEKPKLARRLIFCFLTGNEDMHLKNFSLIKADGVVKLSPAYDLLNTTLVLQKAMEESALPLAGKKKKLSRTLWLDYFARDRLKMSPRSIDIMMQDFANAIPKWHEMLHRCHLSDKAKTTYLSLLTTRLERLNLTLDKRV